MPISRKLAVPKKRRSPPSGAGRAEILRAARQEFASKGYAGASTAGISRSAGVTQPLVHHHFGSKRALWDEVCTELFSSLRVRLEQVGLATRRIGPRDRLRAFLYAFVQFSGERPELSRLMRLESSAGGEPFDRLYQRWMVPILDIVEREFQAAVAEGIAAPVDFGLAFFAVVGAGTQPFAEPMMAKNAFGLDVSSPAFIDRYAELVTQFMLGGLAVARPRAAAKTRAKKSSLRGKAGSEAPVTFKK